MSRETIIILIIVGIALFIWIPAILITARKAYNQGKKPKRPSSK